MSIASNAAKVESAVQQAHEDWRDERRQIAPPAAHFVRDKEDFSVIDWAEYYSWQMENLALLIEDEDDEEMIECYQSLREFYGKCCDYNVKQF